MLHEESNIYEIVQETIPRRLAAQYMYSKTVYTATYCRVLELYILHALLCINIFCGTRFCYLLLKLSKGQFSTIQDQLLLFIWAFGGQNKIVYSMAIILLLPVRSQLHFASPK